MGTERTQKSTVEYPEFIEGQAKDYFTNLHRVWNSQQLQPYEGRYIAEAPELTKSGLAYGNLGTTLQQQGAGQALTNLGLATARGDYLSPESNPYLASYLESALQPIKDVYNQQTVPQTISANVAGNTYDNLRRVFEEAQNKEAYAKALGATSSGILLPAYQSERQLQQLAPQLLTTGADLQRLPVDLQAYGGDLLQQARQNEINNLLMRRYAPWQDLGLWQQGLVPAAGLYQGSGTVTEETGGQGPWAQGIIGGISLLTGAAKAAFGGGGG